MAHILDLKHKKEPEPLPLPPTPVIQHPIVKEKKILTDRGSSVSFDTLSWKSPAVYRREGSLIPYGFASLLFIVAILIAVFQKDIITTILFALLGSMVVVNARRAIPFVDIEISPVGVKRDKRMYPFSDIASFWVQYDPERDIKELSIQMKKWTSPYIKIQLADQDPVQVRSILLEFIPEVKHEEMGTHALTRMLGI